MAGSSGGKKMLQPPIDKPLQKAYLREFTGWSTAYPPSNSDATSCRRMENVVIGRNASISVRPGLRYMSYEQTPDMDSVTDKVPGVAYGRPFVGSAEPFYLVDGTKAMLCAVRETTGEVGFRAIVLTDSQKMVYELTDPLVGFYVPQGMTTLRFTAATRYVSYLQIDNKILALSDAGETMRYFSVGTEKIAKRLSAISQPEWADADKLSVMHPNAAWITKLGYTVQRNELLNPAFEAGTAFWAKGSQTRWKTTTAAQIISGSVGLALTTRPLRENLVTHALPESATDTTGWHSGQGDPKLSISSDNYMRIFDDKGKDVFLARSGKLDGIEEGKKYHLAFTMKCADNVSPRARLQFYRNNGSEIGDPIKFFPKKEEGRYVSPNVEAPNNAVSARVYLGADSTDKASSWIKVNKVVLCRANEDTAFFQGVDHPPQDITVTAQRVNITPGAAVTGSLHVKSATGSARTVDLDMFTYDRNGTQVGTNRSTVTTPVAGNRVSSTVAAASGNMTAGMQVTIRGVTSTDTIYLDGGMIQPGTILNAYFDGSTPSTTQIVYGWEIVDAPHMCPSIRLETVDPTAIPTPQDPAYDDTLVATGGATANPFKMGFFYTFENELGESAPSKITELRIKRPRANWLWNTPDANGHPTGPVTETADLCSDQLVAVIPADVYASAVQAGAIKWHLYTFAWSDQEPVPVEATLSGTRELFPDQKTRQANQALPYEKGGWINLTPAKKFSVVTAPLPTKENRWDFSNPPRARNGIVAGDRIVVVGDVNQPGSIMWTSNRTSEYLKFTSNKGGGLKTLSAGNLHLPCSVVLWQNPQSVDTLTILCLGSDGTSACYYMSPAELNTQSSYTAVMGFEETTNTPGTTSPYGVLVHNNAMFRPLDYALLKSTAQNYNINHKTLTDNIANMWAELQFKEWIVSAEHDNRLFFLVNNPRGLPLEDGCLGNEIWVYDTAGGEKGTWSRMLIQAASLRIVDYGSKVYMGVIRPDGVYYLDRDAREDDYVLDDGSVGQRPIPWFFEMNTQGSNRARDSWAHVQQLSVKFGNFEGTVRYGIRGRSVHGKVLNFFKVFEDYTTRDESYLRWDIEDHLLIRRDLKEWYFSAGSVDGKPSSGSIVFVQYRFTPTTVNVGYEYGSVETFEYGRDTNEGGTAYSQGGIPTEVQDRAWART